MARSCEGAGQWKKDISVAVRSGEANAEYDILRFKLDRNKTNTVQYPLVYAHKNNFLWDAYFGLAIHLAVDTSKSNKLFSDFYDKLGKTDSNKIESKVSKVWSHFFQELKSIMETYTGNYLFIKCENLLFFYT